MKDAVQPLPSSEESKLIRPAGPRNEAFDELLRPSQYRELRGKLVRIFARRGCPVPEDLADETITRVLAKLPEIAGTYEGDPLRFFHAVARNVFREYSRQPRTVPLEGPLQLQEASGGEARSKEVAHQCLEGCLSKLNDSDRELIREYYRFDKVAKIDRRKAMASHREIAMNTLRIKAYRIRQRLAACVFDCLKKNGAIMK